MTDRHFARTAICKATISEDLHNCFLFVFEDAAYSLYIHNVLYQNNETECKNEKNLVAEILTLTVFHVRRLLLLHEVF